MTTTDTHQVRHGDLVTLIDDAYDGATTTYRFVDQYRPEADQGSAEAPADLYEVLTAGSAIGQRLVGAKVGDTLTITHLDHTFTVHFLAHQPASPGATDGPHT